MMTSPPDKSVYNSFHDRRQRKTHIATKFGWKLERHLLSDMGVSVMTSLPVI